jgi:ABC-2 type transport system permease protein
VRAARETWLVFQHQVALMLRNPVWLVLGITEPVLYLLLFAPLLKNANIGDTNAETYSIFVPGLLVLLALLGGLFQGFALLAELAAGVIERARVTPVTRLSLLLGRALRGVVVILFQSTMITLIAVPLGLRVGVADVVLAFMLLGLITLTTSALSYGLALKIGNQEAFAPLVNAIGLPTNLLSGVLLPLTLAPAWIQWLAIMNPFSWGVFGVRALFAGDLGNSVVWISVAIMATLAMLAVVWSARQFARTIR